VEGFLHAASARDFQRAAQYLDLGDFPSAEAKTLGPNLARHLKIILDQRLAINGDSLSDNPAGQLGDGLPPDVEQIGRIDAPGKSIDIRLRQVPREDGVRVWKFSAASVAPIPGLYKLYGYGLLGEVLPRVFFETEFLDYAHPKVDSESARIRFAGFGTSWLDLEVFSYVNVTDYGEYLEIADDLNLRIMDIVAAAGSSFALPSQTTYIEKGLGRDRDRARAAEEQVKEWRKRRELCLPRFPHEKIVEIDNTLEYPPDGSITSTGSKR
jgi:small-conductance mechanosensitive channel